MICVLLRFTATLGNYTTSVSCLIDNPEVDPRLLRPRWWGFFWQWLIDRGMPIQIFLRILQYCLSREATCFTNRLFVLLDTTTTDSSLFQVEFSSFICAANEEMVVLMTSTGLEPTNI